MNNLALDYPTKLDIPAAWYGPEMANNPKFKYFNDYDDHMMEYNSDLTNSINTFINNLN